MSTEIELRFFDTTSNKMYYIDSVGEFTIEQVYRFSRTNDPYTKVMQFTGLHDCKGVKIFERDIVRDHNGIGEVQYSDKKAAFKVNYHDGFAKWFIDYNLRGERESIEVIGNIHQNSELLK